MRKTMILAVAVAVAAAADSLGNPVVKMEAGAGETIQIGFGASGQGTRFAYYDIHDGGTLLWKTGQSSSSIWNETVATNGLAIIDIRNFPVSSTPPIFVAGFYTGGGKGRIRIVGKDKIGIGYPGSGMNQVLLSAPNDYPEIEFVDVAGNPVNGTVVYYAAVVSAIPTNCTWECSSDRNGKDPLCLFGDKQVFPGGNVSVPAGRTFMVASAGAIAPTQTVTVASGAELTFFPCELACVTDSKEELAKPFQIKPIASSGSLRCSFGVHLETSSSVVRFRDYIGDNRNATVDFDGDISGSGSVDVSANGRVNLSGTVSVPVLARAGATVGIGGATLASLSGEDSGATVSVGEGETGTVAALSGIVTFKGEGTLSIGSAAVGTCIYAATNSCILFAGSPNVPSNAVDIVSGSSRKIYFSFEDDEHVDCSVLPNVTSYEAVVAHGGQVLANLPDRATLRSDAGVSATVAPNPAGGTYSLRLDGGSFTVDDTISWRQEVSHWFDFSQTNTLRWVGQGSSWVNAGTPQMLVVGNESFMLIERALDRRGHDGISLWNRRLYSDGSYNFFDYVYPFIWYDSSVQRHVLRFGVSGTGNRRLPISTGADSSIKATLVVMAFNAVNGGGTALVGTTAGAFGRTANNVSAGITTNTTHDIWVDGVKLSDPTAGNTLKSGFQVISIDTAGENVNGFGWVKRYDDSHGGQRYGEILIFTNAVTERVRCEAEYYLAQKWLVGGYSTDALMAARAAESATNTLNATGAGTISLAGHSTFELGGDFAGTVELGGGNLVIKDALVPYDDSTVPTNGCIGWFDPDSRDTVRLAGDFDNPSAYGGYETTGVRLIFDRANPNPSSGDAVVVGVGMRMPLMIPQALGLGAVRNWLDFDELSGDNNGNCLRIGPYVANKDYSASQPSDILTPYGVGTGFIVLDSSRTAFTPIQSAVNSVSEGEIRSRYHRAIWEETSSEKVRDGETRLNGVTVDQSSGFSGRPELLSFRPTGAVQATVFGNMFDTDDQGNTSGKSLLMGEVLLYSSRLGDDDTARIEGYLMKKWLGILPDSCADSRNATVAGSGTVWAASASQLPRFADGFTGTVGADAGNIEVTIDPETDTVVGAVVAPDATVSLPSECSITVTFTSVPSRPANGSLERSYTVFDCAALSGDVNWTFSFAGGKLPSGTAFVKSDSGRTVRVVVPHTGLMVIVY